ncbi:MAG: hypothetical protein ACUVQS_02380 [Candidatus Bipolaricaulaceae bacterium]
MFDNALLLRYVENWGRVTRVLGCLKKRVGKVALELREFRITPQGLPVNKDPPQDLRLFQWDRCRPHE